MSLVAIPNISEGRDPSVVSSLAAASASGGSRVVDVHSDPIHHRSVFTVAGAQASLIEGMVALAAACAASLDLTSHDGLHPRLGVFDVCPFVLSDEPEEALDAAHATAHRIGSDLGIPVLLYGAAAKVASRKELPDLRRGGLERWTAELLDGQRPDEGPNEIDPHTGLVCVGARPPLIAFNIWLRAGLAEVRAIAGRVRASGGGLPGVRALGLEMGDGWSQVSMNLTEPERAGIDDVFDAVQALAAASGISGVRGEIVGVPPLRYMPDPEREAARQISPPGRSLESLLPT